MSVVFGNNKKRKAMKSGDQCLFSWFFNNADVKKGELVIHLGKNGKYILTDKGWELVSKIDKKLEVFTTEKIALSILSKKLTDNKIRQLSDIWRNTYAENKSSSRWN